MRHNKQAGTYMLVCRHTLRSESFSRSDLCDIDYRMWEIMSAFSDPGQTETAIRRRRDHIVIYIGG